MIFGYMAAKRYSEIEESLTKNSPEASVAEFEIGGRQAFFFQHSANRLNRLSYRDADRLLMCDGIPVRHSQGKGYEIIGSLTAKDVQQGFDTVVDSFISNVNVVFFTKGQQDAEIILASSRIGPGKIYYRHIADGIAFSTEFTSLLKFGSIDVNEKALYFIIRYGYSPPPVTISRDIHAVPNSHLAAFDMTGKNISTRPYFKFDYPQSNGSDLDSVSKVLDESAEVLHLAGCSLLTSGGIDSTLFAHKMRQFSQGETRTYYLRFGENDPELPFAEQAAQATGNPLKIFDMDSDVIPDTILEVAASYPHPFNDYSTIATYYIMKCAGEYENENLIFDGNGGDDCFGLGFWQPWLARRQNILYGLPVPVKAAAFKIASRRSLLDKQSGIISRLIRAMLDYNEKEIYQVNLVLCPWTDVFEANTRTFDVEMGDLAADSITALLKPLPHNDSYYAKATVAWMRHVTCGMWCAKTYGIKSLPALQPVYPYTWKGMLEEQGKVSWAAKVNNGIVKWPLKRLLEDYMPHDFIYRGKSGFTPPLESWFANKKLYELLHDILLSQHTVTERIINREKLRQIIERLPGTSQWPMYVGSFLWGSLFTELWVKNNGNSPDKL
jgi:asparagine synthase (glutamine-hydrolysing)